MLERMRPHLGLFMSAEFYSEHLPVFKLAPRGAAVRPSGPSEMAADAASAGRRFPFSEVKRPTGVLKSGMFAKPPFHDTMDVKHPHCVALYQ